MPCITPDGRLSSTAKNLLQIMEKPMDLEEIRKYFPRPTYILRSMMRELIEGGLVQMDNELYSITSLGSEKIKTS
jgi:predicted transcriptional regulator